MTREVKNGKVACKGGQCGRMDHHVWQVVPSTNNTVREKSISMKLSLVWRRLSASRYDGVNNLPRVVTRSRARPGLELSSRLVASPTPTPSGKSGPKDQVALLYFAFALVHDSRGIEIVNFTISLALSAGMLMASAGTPYRLVPAHFHPCQHRWATAVSRFDSHCFC